MGADRVATAPSRVTVLRGPRADAAAHDGPSGPGAGLPPGLPGTLEDRLGPVHGRVVVCARLSPPTPVSALVLEALVDALVDRGADEVVVGSTLRGGDRDRGHRSVGGMAAAAGLTARTARGRTYVVADLLHDTGPAPVPETGVLHGHPVSALWRDATTRVVVAGSVTDLADGIAGALDTMLALAADLPGADPADVAHDLAAHLPPDLVVVDALVTSDGADGARVSHPVGTGAVLVAEDPAAADSVLAGLLGLDRSVSRLVARCASGSPPPTVDGDGSPFAAVAVAHPLARAAARRACAEPRLARVLAAAAGTRDAGATPADPLLEAVAALLTPALRGATDGAGAAALSALLALTASAAEARTAWATVYAKDEVDRVVVPLGFDPAAHAPSAYDDLPAFIRPFEEALRDVAPTGPEGMRWRLVDGATVFETSRLLAADFESVVARVDVAEGISLMADYLGGRRVVVPGSRDGRGPERLVRQAERNVYLPQPNWLAGWGGLPIDVCKVELVDRAPDRHQLWWRTVRSPNGSAVHDDGTLVFLRRPRGTLAVVRGRQRFALPVTWGGLDPATLPELHTTLLEDAYRRFFAATFDNLEACVEGRSFRIGRPAPAADEPLLTESVRLVLEAAGEWFEERTGVRLPAAPGPTVPDQVDVDGFRHVRGPR
ncbi:hypothetical protein [Phycicoccus sp.]|uniref:hypothetical protein n=1 Tax=Phycicoccus sp. TaxID=1902410 RepID=UPI002CB0F7CF|nr:hypothetical protein [Phycicoccus sp.]HMM96816.1 hypothetical protein [Phycicoccus sp.]